MEPSELFMWVWAIGATMLAVLFNHRASMRGGRCPSHHGHAEDGEHDRVAVAHSS